MFKRTLIKVHVPEFAGLSVGVLLQRQLVDQSVYDSADVVGVNAAQSCVHPQRLTDRHLVNESVELWTEPDHTSTGTCCAAHHAHAAEERVARRDGRVTGQHGERRRLPSTVDAEQTEALASRYTDRQPVDGQETVVVELG